MHRQHPLQAGSESPEQASGLPRGPRPRTRTLKAAGEGVDALRAYRQHLISEQTYLTLIRRTKERLLAAEVIDLNLRGNHLLLSILLRTGHLITGRDHLPDVRISSFELLKRLG